MNVNPIHDSHRRNLRHGGQRHPWMRISGMAVALLTSIGMMACALPAASANDGGGGDAAALAHAISGDGQLLEAAVNGAGTQTTNWADGAPAATPFAAMPSSYDLRDEGVVTPVKYQNPWGTCWGFSAVAAVETSILSDLKGEGKAIDAADMDLSEMQLAWFTYAPLPDDDSSGQGGEGVHNATDNANAMLGNGGFPLYATSVYSSGIGPVSEEDVPYRNHEGKASNGYYYDAEGDWSVDESQRFRQSYELEESRTLPVPAGTDDAGDYVYNAAATDAMKRELLDGRAVSIAFTADTSRPGQTDPAQYINTDTWAHYTYRQDNPNHAVTVVGWDDGYSKDNFLEGHRPPADGAWIVKNSWGAKDQKFPNQNPTGWGVDGNGYFYLSYYDQSLTYAETFDFYTQNLEDHPDQYYANQYDYLPSASVLAPAFDGEASMANVFTAEADQLVRTMTAETTRPNTTVTYRLYLLDEDAKAPTDGVLKAERTATYEYGGFHRMDLEGDARVPVREGQRYAVVVTARCEDDSKYYLAADYGTNQAYRDDVAIPELTAKYYDDYYQKAYDALIAGGVAEDEAKSRADASAKAAIEALYPSYSKAVVNAGESYASENGEWSDWAEVVPQLAAANGGYVDIDNFPIKAYADPIDLDELATAEQIKALEDEIKDARNDLDGTAVSADGKDVAIDATWVTQDIHDAFAAAIAAAEQAVGTANPTVSVITETSAALALARGTFDQAKRNGMLECTPTQFADVIASTPHKEDIDWLSCQNITEGFENPDGSVSFGGMRSVVRQDMAAFLYRMAGSPDFDASTTPNPFVDVTEKTPHYKEILWLASTGIAKGYVDRTTDTVSFGGMRSVVRQDMAAFLHRYADRIGGSPELGEGIAFTDVTEETPHAEDIAWLAKAGVTKGFLDGTFGGMRSVVRQDMAAFLHRMEPSVG